MAPSGHNDQAEHLIQQPFGATKNPQHERCGLLNIDPLNTP